MKTQYLTEKQKKNESNSFSDINITSFTKNVNKNIKKDGVPRPPR